VNSYVTAEISASAVHSNLALLRGCLGPATRLCASIKADCFGHGSRLLLDVIAPLADMLAVTLPEEAVTVHRLGAELPILSFISACAYGEPSQRDEAIEELIERNIIQTITSAEEIPLVGRVARRCGKQAQVHVKVDTGMGRSGVIAHEAAEVVRQASDEPGLRLTGLYSHLATADEEDRSFAIEQIDVFRRVIAECDGAKGLIRHLANSAATVELPESHFDMVRPGVAVFGYQPWAHAGGRCPLRPALRLTGRLLPVRELPAGVSCGYGLTHTFDRPSRVACVPTGYGDGYLRCLSNLASASVRGVDVPICGQVSMDLLILDVTEVPGARMGDEVELISPEWASPRSVEGLARLAGTIPQEVTSRLGSRIRRVLVD